MSNELISGRAAALLEFFPAAARTRVVSADFRAIRRLLAEITRFAPRLEDGPSQMGILDQRVGKDPDDRAGKVFQARLPLALLVVGLRKPWGGEKCEHHKH